jgi:hypothetical protein
LNASSNFKLGQRKNRRKKLGDIAFVSHLRADFLAEVLNNSREIDRAKTTTATGRKVTHPQIKCRYFCLFYLVGKTKIKAVNH